MGIPDATRQEGVSNKKIKSRNATHNSRRTSISDVTLRECGGALCECGSESGGCERASQWLRLPRRLLQGKHDSMVLCRGSGGDRQQQAAVQ